MSNGQWARGNEQWAMGVFTSIDSIEQEIRWGRVSIPDLPILIPGKKMDYLPFSKTSIKQDEHVSFQTCTSCSVDKPSKR
jgi:hypothetical protein